MKRKKWREWLEACDSRIVRRFLEKVEFTGSCWLWKAHVNQTGYGCFGVGTARYELAHRTAYRWCFGAIPKGKVVHHRCGVRSCVNPDHLEAVTWNENFRRGNAPAAVNLRKEYCSHGHPFNVENTGYRRDRPGQRYCRQCAADSSRAYRQRKQTARYRPVELKRIWEAVSCAVRDGRLVKPTACELCGRAVRLEAHHRDYSCPLDVIWLCRICHCKEEP